VHAAAYSADVGSKQVIIPRNATVFSAAGMLTSKLIHTLEQSALMRSPFKEAQYKMLNSILEDLEKKLYEQFESEGVESKDVEIRRSLMMRFCLQFHQIEVPLGNEDLSDISKEGMIEGIFRNAYELLYGKGSGVAEAECEIMGVRVLGVNSPFVPKIRKTGKSDPSPAKALKGHRSAYSDARGAMIPTSVYDGDALCCGNYLEGPAIVERWGDTVVIPEGQSAIIDEYNNIVIKLNGGKK
jgi:N-methylhydantoinase A/oxoprolinase/acetone carboxylase beta subunit